ncbi:hypothetical protein EVAR_102547_1 [Eumeta japonica]|uniref:RNA-directed DNA polymerase from mobile element jockey n=1 Tax=Eumeta variegata TaxID=151549 RepID=A0A4C2A4B7_EUMVA|nr:hypothetical protein EVAR_102547_1 [Eumeta japonica]
MAAGAADGDPPDHHSGSGPNSNSAASTAPYPRSTPSSLRVMYWNAGASLGRRKTYEPSSSRRTYMLSSWARRNSDLGKNSGCPISSCIDATKFPPMVSRTEVLVRRDVFHGGLELPDFINTRTLGIRVGAAGTELRLFAAYRPPVTRFCSSDIRTIFEDHTPTILAGDLNAKHTSTRPISCPDGPRFGADVLDVVLCHRLPFPIHVEVLYSADTQHLPILITLSTTAHLTPARPQTHRTNWSAYQHALEAPHRQVLLGPSPVRQVSTMKSRARLGDHTSSGSDWPPMGPSFTPAARAQHKRNLQRLWAGTRCPRVKRDLNRIALELRQEVWTFRGAAWEETIGQTGEDWKSPPAQPNSSSSSSVSIVRQNGMRRYAAKDRAEILAEH